MGIENIDAIEEVHEEIHQAEVDIAKLKEEIAGLMPIQQMIQSSKSKKLQIQLQKLHDELVNLAHKVETKLAKFKETQATVGK